MKAIVVLMNLSRGMIAAQTEDGEYVIFELLSGSAIEIGDTISHEDFYSLGSEDYNNVTKREVMNVYVQNICGSFDQAKRQCFL
jgi:hypothetical protein